MAQNFLAGGGKMGELIASHNWSTHQLGPIERWPLSLTSSLGMCLHSQFPMTIYWGKELTVLYNDAWSPILGDRHPWALGKPAGVVWNDIWDIIEPTLTNVLKNGEGSLSLNSLLPIRRHGFTEEAYFDYTFNPIFSSEGEILGILNVANETTRRILAERRARTLRRLSQHSVIAESAEAACILVANTLSEAPADIPYALIYLQNQGEDTLRLVATTSLDSDSSIARKVVRSDKDDGIVPFATTLQSRKPQVLYSLENDFIDLPGGPWEEAARDAVVLPLVHPRTNETYGVVLLGVSPRLVYDNNYNEYCKQIAELTAISISSALNVRRKLNLEAREHEAQEQLQTALASGSIGIWSWDIQSNLVMSDRHLARIFGIRSLKAQSGLPMEEFTNAIHADDRQRVIKGMKTSINKVNTYEDEYRIVTRDGSIRWVLARGRVEVDKNDKPARFPLVIVDITERKTVEADLVRSERKFNALFGSSILGVVVANVDGSVREANQTFLDMFGYTKQDLKKGFNLHTLLPSNNQRGSGHHFKDIAFKGQTEPTEQEYTHKNGKTIPTLTGAVMIPDSPGRFICFMLDISRQKELLALNKAKDEFISIASHQLRTPATGVKQYLGMLLEGYAGTISQYQRNIIQTAYDSNERQLTVVNDLLRVAQADAGEIKLHIETVEITSLMRDVIAEQAQKFIAKKQEIKFRAPKKAVLGDFDPILIRMVLENLIDNAHKYTGSGKTVTVRVTQSTATIRIYIKDQGIGIRKKDMSKLFKKFSRIENPMTLNTGGTGLGLYWVHKIVEVHKGEIAVESHYRQGTEFILSFPVKGKGRVRRRKT